MPWRILAQGWCFRVTLIICVGPLATLSQVGSWYGGPGEGYDDRMLSMLPSHCAMANLEMV